MAKYTFSGNDVERLSRRLEDRSWSELMPDMPELQGISVQPPSYYGSYRDGIAGKSDRDWEWLR